MKKIILLFLISIMGYAQIGLGTNSPHASATLELNSTSRGFLPPRMIEFQRDAITSPVAGLIIYCTDCGANGQMQVYNGTTWTNTAGGLADNNIVQDRYFGQTINGANNHNFRYMPVVAADGKIWLNNNLGAHYANVDHASYNPGQQASSATDHLAYGSLFQWGRKADGHELITYTNGTTGTAVNGITSTTSNDPANALFVNTSSFGNWRVDQDDALWATEASANNPCPVGFRVPTNTELTALFTSSNITNSVTAASSTMKFTAPGYRYYNSGSLNVVSNYGYYWSSSSLNGTSLSIYRGFDSSTTETSSNYRSNGYSVRCIKD